MLNVELPRDPEIPLLAKHPRELQTVTQKQMYAHACL
jgi:hypothetical protein